jgi:carbon dioxide concentrating mechanism protein CcmL
MKLCKVIGKANSSIKHPGLEGLKLLVVQAVDSKGKGAGRMILAVDTIGAGTGEVVAVVKGAAAVKNIGKGDIPCDAAIVAIMDHVFANEKEIYSKHKEA